MRTIWRVLPVAMLQLTMLIGTVGCGGVPTPRSRSGSLPFPGITTLFTTVDPHDLGDHYSSLCECDQPHGSILNEVGRGIIYTHRAGFIDISHIRDTADWTYYLYHQVRAALVAGKGSLTLSGLDRSRMHLTLRYPPNWAQLLEEHNVAIINETALRIAGQVTYRILTWHEIITGFGYASSGVVPENRSSFTYEDGVSHAVGWLIAGDAIRAETGCYDHAIAAAMNQWMIRLDATDEDTTMQAVHAVRGRWWQPEIALRYHYDAGLDTHQITPWLVKDISPSHAWLGDPLPLPRMDEVIGHDLSGFYTLQIEPRIFESRRIRSLLPSNPKRIEPVAHFPILIEYLREQTKQEFGEDSDQP